jgi:hypothetical protein
LSEIVAIERAALRSWGENGARQRRQKWVQTGSGLDGLSERLEPAGCRLDADGQDRVAVLVGAYRNAKTRDRDLRTGVVAGEARRGRRHHLVEKYGYDDIAAALRERGGLPDPEQADQTGGIEDIDDFSACKITRKEDWVDLYAKPYYFGCEADDRMNATAFGRNNPFGSKLNAIFSSDIGHFDVIDMRDPLPEAFELVEDGHISADDFRAFTFANAEVAASLDQGAAILLRDAADPTARVYRADPFRRPLPTARWRR